MWGVFACRPLHVFTNMGLLYARARNFERYYGCVHYRETELLFLQLPFVGQLAYSYTFTLWHLIPKTANHNSDVNIQGNYILIGAVQTKASFWLDSWHISRIRFSFYNAQCAGAILDIHLNICQETVLIRSFLAYSIVIQNPTRAQSMCYLYLRKAYVH